VSLYVGEACVSARVAAVRGDEASVTLTKSLPADAGFLPAETQLAFEHEGHLIMLSGMLYPARTGDPLRFVIADGVRETDKRRHVRLSVALDAVATPVGDDGDDAGSSVASTTLDVSAGGVLLACGGLSGRVRVVLELPGSAGTIEAVGTVVRSSQTRTAIAFLALPAEDQAMLDRFVTVVRTELARRFARAA
jgi:hypothetical protein